MAYSPYLAQPAAAALDSRPLSYKDRGGGARVSRGRKARPAAAVKSGRRRGGDGGVWDAGIIYDADDHVQDLGFDDDMQAKVGSLPRGWESERELTDIDEDVYDDIDEDESDALMGAHVGANNSVSSQPLCECTSVDA